ncbi:MULTISPECIES: replication initiation and membrane attachment family protein [Pontibacillus]|uniref:DnaD domain protein n=1 Tax=Pontibacillus chungwhensis TaxID=265426 RepID=A0ABY8UXS9_9BACI|nr:MULTISPECIES: DnaD domain protein [Pontibacillus]MCD5323816.1 DnaD domain protein [Pontibacillus sp. HN14]WIF97179.1 DnaD domain protein [Pontibacillus chungwhensis]
MEHTSIGKLLPVDGFRLKVARSMPMDFTTSLTHLYQPLIGNESISLYQTLLSEYDLQEQAGDVRTHHLLMSYLNLPLNHIYEARKRLEAIGLLRTFVDQSEEHNLYTYILLRPFTPSEFFADEMLSLLLYHHLGQQKYERLQRTFSGQSSSYEKGEEVTSSFEYVFSMGAVATEVPPSQFEEQDQDLVESQGANIKESQIDFSYVKQSLDQRMLPVQSILTNRNQKVISQLSLLYNLTTNDVEKAILWALNDENQLDLSELKEACHDLYQSKGGQSEDLQVTHKRDSLAVTDHNQEPQKEQQADNKEEALIQRLEHISPRELLQDLSGGAEPPEKDLRMIRDIMTQQGLTPGVMNVLIYYVLLKTDMKLSKNYMETIAGHWTRLQVKTVRHAMRVAKTENKKYQQWANNRKSGGKRSYNKNQKQDVLPDWFKDQKGQSSDNQDPKRQSGKSASEIEREKQELAEALKNMDD